MQDRDKEIAELKAKVTELEDHVIAHHIIEDQARDRAKSACRNCGKPECQGECTVG